MSFSGGCLCGAIRYEVAAAPAMSAHCHCRDCQKTSGAGHSTNVVVATGALRISGTIARYETQGGSGASLTRIFCPTCGSSLLTETETLPGMTIVKAGSLDDASAIDPQVHIFCRSAQPWDQPPAGRACFDETPPL